MVFNFQTSDNEFPKVSSGSDVLKYMQILTSCLSWQCSGKKLSLKNNLVPCPSASFTYLYFFVISLDFVQVF